MRRTDREKGRDLLTAARRDLRGEAVVDGVAPRKGMFLINHTRRRAYGRIVRVRRSGAVVWERLVGSCSVATPKKNGDTLKITTDPDALRNSGASYVDAIPEGYSVLSDTHFAEQPNTKEEPMPAPATTTLLEKLINKPLKEKIVKTVKTATKKAAVKKTATKTPKPDTSKRESEIQKAVKAFLRKSPKETCPATAAHIGDTVNGFKSMDRDARFKEVRPVMRAMARDGVLLRKKGKSPHNGRPAWLYSVA